MDLICLCLFVFLWCFATFGPLNIFFVLLVLLSISKHLRTRGAVGFSPDAPSPRALCAGSEAELCDARRAKHLCKTRGGGGVDGCSGGQHVSPSPSLLKLLWGFSWQRGPIPARERGMAAERAWASCRWAPRRGVWVVGSRRFFRHHRKTTLFQQEWTFGALHEDGSLPKPIVYFPEGPL